MLGFILPKFTKITADLRRKQLYFSVTLGTEIPTTPAVEFLTPPLLGLAKGKDARFLSDFA